MRKYTAPPGADGINVGGEQFNVDKDGTISVPDTGDYDGLLRGAGYLPAPDVPAAPLQTSTKSTVVSD